jgi:hypothetical protein
LLEFVAVRQGTCRMTVSGMDPSELAAGDAFLLINSNGYAVSSGPRAKLMVALADRHIGSALALMHAQPGRGAHRAVGVGPRLRIGERVRQRFHALLRSGAEELLGCGVGEAGATRLLD